MNCEADLGKIGFCTGYCIYFWVEIGGDGNFCCCCFAGWLAPEDGGGGAEFRWFCADPMMDPFWSRRRPS